MFSGMNMNQNPNPANNNAFGFMNTANSVPVVPQQ